MPKRILERLTKEEIQLNQETSNLKVEGILVKREGLVPKSVWAQGLHLKTQEMVIVQEVSYRPGSLTPKIRIKIHYQDYPISMNPTLWEEREIR